ncbi:hypothetical protein [Brucella pituitosa]|uniref:hypothetical protein n=1 Tax=Brucella pituitosa TaxID=571256 RepID=UPI0009A13ADB
MSAGRPTPLQLVGRSALSMGVLPSPMQPWSSPNCGLQADFVVMTRGWQIPATLTIRRATAGLLRN